MTNNRAVKDELKGGTTRLSAGKLLLWLLIISMAASCANSGGGSPGRSRIVQIVPLGTGHSKAENTRLLRQLAQVFDSVYILPLRPMPASAWYKARNRYRADSAINIYERQAKNGVVTLLLTHTDISTTKGEHNDWGVMGLAHCPGRACIISDFRCGKDAAGAHLYKLAVHELGHTEGLRHCREQTCFMRDAAGKNHLDQLTGFCNSCANKLRNKGWEI